MFLIDHAGTEEDSPAGQIGDFYRWTIIENYDDVFSIGGRADIYFPTDRRVSISKATSRASSTAG